MTVVRYGGVHLTLCARRTLVLHRGGVWLLVRMRDAGDASESHMDSAPPVLRQGAVSR